MKDKFSFEKINASYTRLQSLARNHYLQVRLEGQYSEDVLTSLEQYAMGGPNSVRAYPISEYLHDSALFTSVEWIINAPGIADKPAFGGRNWGEVLQFSIFADYANGHLNKSNSPDKNVELSGAGISLDFRPNETFFARMDVATPLGSRDASNNHDPQMWLTGGFNF